MHQASQNTAAVRSSHHLLAHLRRKAKDRRKAKSPSWRRVGASWGYLHNAPKSVISNGT